MEASVNGVIFHGNLTQLPQSLDKTGCCPNIWHLRRIKVKSADEPRDPSGPEFNSSFRSMKPLGILLLPLDGMLVHRKVTSEL